MTESKSDTAYARQLTDCSTLDELRALVTFYSDLSVDAVSVVAAMTADDFTEFRRGLRSERKGRFAGEPWMLRFGAVLMPMPMLRISQIADQFKAPFDVTWRRLRDVRPDLLTVPSALPESPR